MKYACGEDARKKEAALTAWREEHPGQPDPDDAGLHDEQLGDRHRHAEAEKMLDMFKRARGRAYTNMDELAEFMKEEERAGRKPEGPADPYAQDGKWTR